MNLRGWLSRFGAMYGAALRDRPFLTEMTTSALLWSAGDVAAQLLESQQQQQERKHPALGDPTPNAILNDSLQKIDWRRNTIMAVYASLVWAPLAHHWYKVLDRIALHVAKKPGTPRFLTTKVMLEIVALHPLALLAFFCCVGVMNGESVSAISSQIRRDFIPTLGLEVALWTPLDFANFRFIPVRHQLLTVNCVCFFESVGLSFIKANGISLPGE